VSPVRRVGVLCRQTGDTNNRRVKRWREQSDTGGVPQTILVCDNEEAMRALVRAALDPSGCEIVEARDGDESVELARSLEPDLIVLDLMMPGRSGFEVLDELRTEPRFETTPVIVLSARAQVADREAVTKAGATSFLTKPFSPRELYAEVTSLLGARR
jgi:two-component system OmpR family response regulator